MLFPAIGAQTIQFKFVFFDEKPSFRCYFILKFLYGFVLELFDGAAAGADQVIVMFALAGRLITCLAVPEINFSGNA